MIIGIRIIIKMSAYLISPQAKRESSASTTTALINRAQSEMAFQDVGQQNLGSARGAPDIARAITMSSQQKSSNTRSNPSIQNSQYDEEEMYQRTFSSVHPGASGLMASGMTKISDGEMRDVVNSLPKVGMPYQE